MYDNMETKLGDSGATCLLHALRVSFLGRPDERCHPLLRE